MKNLLLFMMFLLLFSGCKKSEEATEDMAITAVRMPSKEDSEAISENADMKVNDSREDSAPPPPPMVDQVKFVKPVLASSDEITAEKVEQKIIKTGNIRFETNDLGQTYNQIITAVKKHNAIIQNDTEGKEYGSIFRRITVRVPSKNFDLFLTDISKGVSYFDNKEISSQDVTEEYIDVAARLKAKKTLESRYLELLKKANKVSEMLEIEAQLSAIREEIEAKEGQLRYMQSRVSMSTVNIEFYKTVAIEEGATISYGSKIWNAISSGFNGISSFFIGLLSIWPFLIILAVSFYYIRKRFKKKTT